MGKRDEVIGEKISPPTPENVCFGSAANPFKMKYGKLSPIRRWCSTMPTHSTYLLSFLHARSQINW